VSFRLAALLRVRRLQEEVAAAEAAAAAHRAAAASRLAAERRGELADARPPQQADEWQFRTAVAARSARTSMLTESLAFAEVHGRAAALARGEWSTARSAVRGLERLEERSLAAQAAERLAAEQVLLDEHATRPPGSGPLASPGAEEPR